METGIEYIIMFQQKTKLKLEASTSIYLVDGAVIDE